MVRVRLMACLGIWVEKFCDSTQHNLRNVNSMLFS